MPRPALALVFAAFALAGCNKGPTVVVVQPSASEPGAPASTAPETVVATPVANAVVVPNTPIPIPAPELSEQERFDAALWAGVSFLTDRKYDEALTAFEQAQKIKDGESIRHEIAVVKIRLAAAKAADKTVQDIQNVLIDGRPDEAARLAAIALREYGDSESAVALVKLKLQADALSTVLLEASARAAHFRREAEDADRAGNLRAAVIAYEQATAAGDTTAAPRLAQVRASLSRYDDGRRKAAELRRDPARLDEALAALQDAATAWDTPQVRREIDDCALALQCRRDRLAVAEFDRRGGLSAALLGRSLADSLSAAFQQRFDIVDRGQVERVCETLQLRPGDVIEATAGRAELARLAKVRFLVVGSISPLDGVTAHARLIDLQTGLVVQTARITAPSTDALVSSAPQLAAMLQMTDDQRQAYEQQLARQAAAIPVAVELATLPPPPEPVSGQLPPTVIVTSRTPEVGGVVIEDFARLPRPGVGVDLKLALTGNHKLRGRTLAVAVELGDDLFRRGRLAEARSQFELALALAPGRPEIVARLDACKAAPPPVVSPQPRAAVLDFVALDAPAGAPPVTDRGLNTTGVWAAETIAPYLSPPYELADRGEVSWYMGRLGLTLRDAVCDPMARLFLGRALNVRFIVLGSLRTTPAGLEVVAHLLDTETGAELNTATAVVRDRGELKCRLGEIARWLLLDPAERLRREAEAAQAQALLAQAEVAARASNFTLAIDLTRQAGHKTPGIRVEVLLDQFDRDAQRAALDAQRQASWQRQQALAAAAGRRQQELATAAEAARVAAAQQAASAAAAERQQLREAACRQLIAQARAARDAQNFPVAVQMYESALAINRRAGVATELAAVKTRADEQARARENAEAAVREAAQMQQRMAELARVQAKVGDERKQRAAAELARRKLQEEADAKTRAAAEDAQRQAEQRLKTEAQARIAAAVEAKRQADLRSQTEAQAKAQAEAKRIADAADAKRRADAEAKRQADAKAQTDLAARLKAEAEANARVAEAKRVAEAAEAKRIADAKATAVLEAQQKAEAEERARSAARPPAVTPVTRPTPPAPPPSAPTPPPSKATPVGEPKAFTEQMQAGAAFEKQDRYADARRCYLAALQITAGNAAALWRADYALHMDNGLAARKAGHKPDAAREFEAALRSAPNDPAAMRYLQQAR
jgi:hypothetical protein